MNVEFVNRNIYHVFDTKTSMLYRLFFLGVSSDCPFRNSSIPNNTCLSSNDCNVCKRINGVHEGCHHPFDTTSPVCDADKSNVGIDATARGISECVGCKRSGNRLVDEIKLVKKGKIIT